MSNVPGYKETREYLQQCVSEYPVGAVVADQRYDSLGRVYEADQPHYLGEAAYLITVPYDDLGRKTEH